MRRKRAESKVLAPADLARKAAQAKVAGVTVVQCHGVFDVIHPGIIEHLERARGKGDLLVVTVVSDAGLNAAGRKALFPQETRIRNVVSLCAVDFACLVNERDSAGAAELIAPDLLAVGKTEKVPGGKIRVFETGEVLDEGTSVLTDFVHVYPEETRRFLRTFARRNLFADVRRAVEAVEPLKVLLVGDGIIDEYHYCDTMGRSTKANLVVSKYLSHEVFAGGAFAVANHLAGICRQVDLVTLLGEADSREEFVRSALRPNVKPIFFRRADAPTVIKKRYLHRYLNQKLFEVNYLNDVHIEGDLEDDVIALLRGRMAEYDLVLIADFGHGFVTPRIARTLQRSAARLAVNTQTNAANSGYNLITKYRSPMYACLDELEVRLAAQDKFSPIEKVVRRVAKEVGTKSLLVTLGKAGSIGIDASGKISRTPIFSSTVVDTVGAGDAVFAFTAPCAARGIPLDLVGFIGNVVGAIAVQIMGNQRPVEREEFLELAAALLR
jgi:bifunctional ADP-heptose synthase (sugar kinase/adenylyltransferase)